MIEHIKWTRLAILLSSMLIFAGCSKQNLQRNSYEAVKSIGEQQCQLERGSDCPPPLSYDEYQQQRKSLSNSE